MPFLISTRSANATQEDRECKRPRKSKGVVSKASTDHLARNPWYKTQRLTWSKTVQGVRSHYATRPKIRAGSVRTRSVVVPAHKDSCKRIAETAGTAKLTLLLGVLRVC